MDGGPEHEPRVADPEDGRGLGETVPSLAAGSLRTGMAGGGSLRWAAADLSQVVETARSRLDLSPVAAAALGRSLTCAALLLRLSTKTPVRLLLEIRGDGPLRQVLAEADDGGNLRGTVSHPRVAVPHTAKSKLAVGDAIGRGHLGVLREHRRGTYRSQVELVSGEISEDVAHYLHQSEQTRSAVLVGVLAKPHGVAAAGGMIVEALPGADEGILERLEANISALPDGVSRVVEDGGLERLEGDVLGGLSSRLAEERDLHYRCRCNRARLRQHLAVLSPEERRAHALEDGTIEAECLFCGARYEYAPEDLQSGGLETAAG